LILVSVLLLLAVVGLSTSTGAEPAPLVNKPSGNGPYNVGYTYDNVATSTKSYTVGVKIYYPAEHNGQHTRPMNEDGPFPTIIWLPGFGGSEHAYGEMLTPLSSWGMVVMAVGVNWNDWPNSANIADVEDYLSYLENRTADGYDRLWRMVDTSAFGLSGHSSGGGLSLVDGTFVDRIKAVQTFAAAISLSAVDSIAPDFHKPLLLQCGQDDSGYIENSRRAYKKIEPTNSLVETVGAGHGGPYQMHLLHAFYLYHLAGDQEYSTFLYGKDAVDDFVRGDYDLKFKVSDQVYFPPTVRASMSSSRVPMDNEVNFTGIVDGYYPQGHPDLMLRWDTDGDGSWDVMSNDERNATHVFTSPGTYLAVFELALGTLYIDQIDPPLQFEIYNLPPVAEAGQNVTIDQDGTATFDGSDSLDTASDIGWLSYKWDFGDGNGRDFDTNPRATHLYTTVGEFAVVLTAKDRHGATATDGLTVTVVNVPPVAEAGEDLATEEDSPVELRGRGSDTPSDNSSLRFMWEYGDGMSSEWSSNPNGYHTYRQAGCYTAVLNVKDVDGAVAIDELTVTILNVLPEASIVAPSEDDVFMEDEEVELRGSGWDTASDVDSLSYKWDFGDGNATDWGSYSNAETTHTYTVSDTYIVTFSVQDDDEEVSTVNIELTIGNQKPEAYINKPSGTKSVSEDTAVDFSGSGVDTLSDQGLLTFSWEIDNTTVEGPTTSYTFIKSGTYTVRFLATDPEGEVGEAFVSVRVKNIEPYATANVEPLSIWQNGSINFTAEVTDTPTDQLHLRIEWDFGDGSNSSELSGTHKYTKSGNYTVVFIAMDDDGAFVALNYSVEVKKPKEQEPPPPPPDDDDGDDSAILYIAAGGVGAVIVIILLLLLMFKRRPETGHAPLDEDLSSAEIEEDGRAVE
jgi:PKD repeat protein/dienelactone hydrolase